MHLCSVDHRPSALFPLHVCDPHQDLWFGLRVFVCLHTEQGGGGEEKEEEEEVFVDLPIKSDRR